MGTIHVVNTCRKRGAADAASDAPGKEGWNEIACYQKGCVNEVVKFHITYYDELGNFLPTKYTRSLDILRTLCSWSVQWSKVSSIDNLP